MTNVRIYQPAKNAMQSGRAKDFWILEYAPSEQKTTDPLMGWVGSSDTRGQLRVKFPNKEEAIEYAKSKNLSYTVQEAKKRIVRAKNYADKFAANRITY